MLASITLYSVVKVVHQSEGGQRWKNFSARENVSTYIRQKLPDVFNSAVRQRELHDSMGGAEFSFFKSGTMAVMWCARECCLEAWSTAATLSQVFRKSTVQDVVQLQKTIEHLKETADVGTVFRPVHRADVVFGQFADGPLPQKGEIQSVGW